MKVQELLEAAVKAKPIAAALTEEEKNKGLHFMAESLLAHTEEILEANAEDLAAYGDGVMADRLRLDASRIQGMAAGIEDVSKLPDPVGRVLERRTLYNGLEM